MGIIFPAKSNLAVFESEQTVVGDGHAVSVAAQISQDLLWTTKGRLGINPPFTGTKIPEQTLESWWLGQAGAGAMKGELAMVESLGQRCEKEPAKQARQHRDGQKEALVTTNPAPTVG